MALGNDPGAMVALTACRDATAKVSVMLHEHIPWTHPAPRRSCASVVLVTCLRATPLPRCRSICWIDAIRCVYSSSIARSTDDPLSPPVCACAPVHLCAMCACALVSWWQVWPTDARGNRTASLATLKHPKLVCSVSVDGLLAVTGCHDDYMRLWSLDAAGASAYMCTHTIDHGHGLGAPVGEKAWITTRLVGGALVSGGGEAGTVKVWALGGPDEPPECIGTLAHGQAVRGVVCAPYARAGGGTIVSVGGQQSDSSVVVWWPRPWPVPGQCDEAMLLSAVDGADDDALVGRQHNHGANEALGVPKPQRARLTRRMSSLF